MSMVRDLWRKEFTNKVYFDFRVNSEGVINEKSGEEKDG